jgi:UDP-glucose 4-epimerase
LLTGQIPIINGDGGQTRDYTYVEDVAAATLKALEHPEVTGGVNICTGLETSVNDLYRALIEAAGSPVQAQHAPARPGEQRRSCLAPALAARALGWKPTVSLAEGLRRTFAFFQKEIAS